MTPKRQMKEIKSLLLMCTLETPNMGSERTGALFLYSIPIGFFVISIFRMLGLSMLISYGIGAIIVLLLQ